MGNHSRSLRDPHACKDSADGHGAGLLGCRKGLAPWALVFSRSHPLLLDVSFTDPKAKEKLLVVEFHFGEFDQSLCRRK